MKKDQILSAVRSILLALGAFFAGKLFFGTPIDDDKWQGVVGSVVGIGSVIWGILDKTATIEMVQSALRSIVIIIGGFLITTGKLKEETLNSILGLVAVIAPMIYGWLSIKKSEKIATGILGIADLKGVDEKKPELITPTVETPLKP